MQPRNLKWEKNKNIEGGKNKALNFINKRPWNSVYCKYAQIRNAHLLLFHYQFMYIVNFTQQLCFFLKCFE